MKLERKVVTTSCSFRIIFILTSLLSFTNLNAQVSTEPGFPTAEDEIRIIYDATKGTTGLAGAAKVYMHSGVILDSPAGTSWQNVVGNWGQDNGIGQMTKVTGETDKWEITLSPREYFNIPSAPIFRIGMVFRNADGSKEGKTDANTDIFVNLSQGGFDFVLNEPEFKNVFVATNDQIVISATSSTNATFKLLVGGIEINTQGGISEYTYTHTVAESSGTVDVVLEATDGTETVSKGFTYVLRTPSEVASRPPGTRRGINYFADDETRAILCLEAPTNLSGYVIGDFTDWKIDSNFKLKQDGDFFWIEITGLTPGTEYAFRYLIDETIYIADPYSDKILDPDDRFIDENIYPGLKTFPEAALVPQWYFNRLSILQTGQEDFFWQNDNYQKPEKEKLVIYELLIRDFFGPGQESFQNLIDTLSYFKSLGINTIELMPVTEFNGNDSWGYNNTFMFAPDKAYGPKNKLKEFIDAAHSKGIAVVLDVVMNHHDIPSPLLLLDFDYTTFKPGSTNPWFNVEAPHSVIKFFFDIKHSSVYTQSYLDSLNHYWINEYHFDGFRFDFSKGFTQKFTSSFESLAQYDPQRVSLLKRMANKIWSYSPDTYVILEHFADNTEETDLANSGMLLWGNSQYAYKQNALGFVEDSDIDWIFHRTRGWNNAHLVGYVESHDEQRLMFENLNYGNQSGFYDARNLHTALNRMKAIAATFFSIPGPKMIWQFQELGYDIDINQNGRVGRKPVPWNDAEGLDYNHEEARVSLRNNFAEMIKLKNAYSIFSTADVTFLGENTLIRQIILKNDPYTKTPANHEEMNVVVISNFDIISKNISVNFPHTGTWYNYFANLDEVQVESLPHTVELNASDFRIFTDYRLPKPDLITSVNDSPLTPGIHIYPNPVNETMTIDTGEFIPFQIRIISLSGQILLNSTLDSAQKHSVDVSFLPNGMHILVMESAGVNYVTKIIKQ